MTVRNKIGKLSDIGEFIKDGSFVGIGGGWSCNKPMAIIREIIRQRIKGLKVISIVGGWEMEWLLAAGAIDHLCFSFLSLEAFGLPPNFRRVAEKKLIKLTEIEGCSIVKGLQAAGRGVPFAAFAGPKGSDIVNEAPELYKTVTCPFFRPEVDLVVHSPFGASPCSCVPYYPAHLMQMMKDVRGIGNPETAGEYIQQLIGGNEEEYMENAGGETTRKKLVSLAKNTRKIDFPDTLSDQPAAEFDAPAQIVVSLARTIDDGDSIILGSFTPLAYTAYMLAKLTHAPNAFIVGYSGVDPLPFQLGFHTSEAACTEFAAGLWSMTECIEALHLRGMGDVEAVSSAQLDANGDINISWLAMPVKDSEGNPTGEINPRAIRLPGGAGAPVVYGLHRKSVAYFAGHSRNVFVPKVNYITGTRYYFTDEERRAQGLRPGPMLVVTNLCVMQMVERGRWKVLSLHRGVTAEDVINNTGFEVEIPPDCPVTKPPTAQEIELIGNIDPQDIRLLDFMSGKERAAKLPSIIEAEWESA